ncbi:hypothetical protein DAPPUDRAFT_248497 [Daphnia pulex]|uniref:Uncharacterized protein n=1 Tax=Daphnia pulex TaxID=6669 RepID=E9GUS2_DAPPU|nr:hypothetical protein DAPPUDRAFT_248497 [Daphnia pulex]|eukprot:EFX76786.1 hypothetical protein DAPPUDRAFT_248497 [Daphnia pulex]
MSLTGLSSNSAPPAIASSLSSGFVMDEKQSSESSSDSESGELCAQFADLFTTFSDKMMKKMNREEAANPFRNVGGAVANYAAKTATDEFLEDVVEKEADKIMDSMNTSLIEAIYKFQFHHIPLRMSRIAWNESTLLLPIICVGLLLVTMAAIDA